MDNKELKKILIENKIYVKENSKNFICKCCYCSDHPNPKKAGHLYISKNASVPVGHCWFCGEAWPIPKIIRDLTGDKNKYKDVISDSELKNQQHTGYKKTRKNTTFKLPEISEDGFPVKKMYIRKRTGNKITAEKVPNLILNFFEFLKINNLDIVGKNKKITDYEADTIQKNFVCFLSKNNTILYCRNSDENSSFKFKKIPLKEDPFLLLDYWQIPLNKFNNTIVLSEGNFDILSEYCFDSLDIQNDVRLYASGNTFSYQSLLKSICFNENMYKPNVIILSDTDKIKKYQKFLKYTNHVMKSCKIYFNKRGKDFGIYPPLPSRVY